VVIWNWKTIRIVDVACKLYDKLKSAGYLLVSKELVHQLLNGKHIKSFIVRDPDGHAIFLKEYAKEQI